MKIAKFLFIFSLFLASAFANSLTLKVTVSQGTLAVGTNVTLVKGGVDLGSQKADSKGQVYFNVTPGSYFVKLARGGYPLHVSLLEMGQSDKSTELNMRQLISYANAYGVISGPADFSGTTISAYSDGKIVGKYKPNRDGYYVVQFLPSGSYEFVFESPGFEKKAVQLFLNQADFLEANVALSQENPNPPSGPEAPTGKIVLTAPEQVKVGTVITISLTQSGKPLANQKITANTPAGQVVITTDSIGIARVNAAQEGDYFFSYGNVTASTRIPSSAQKPADVPSPAVPGPVDVYVPPQQGGQATGPSEGAGVMVFLTMAGSVALVALCIVALFVFIKNMKRKEGAAPSGGKIASLGPQPGFQPSFPVDEKLGAGIKPAKPAHKHAHQQKKKK